MAPWIFQETKMLWSWGVLLGRWGIVLALPLIATDNAWWELMNSPLELINSIHVCWWILRVTLSFRARFQAQHHALHATTEQRRCLFSPGSTGSTSRVQAFLVDLWISSLMDDNEWNNGSWLRMTTLLLTMIDENDCNWFRMVLITRLEDSNTWWWFVHQCAATSSPNMLKT